MFQFLQLAGWCIFRAPTTEKWKSYFNWVCCLFSHYALPRFFQFNGGMENKTVRQTCARHTQHVTRSTEFDVAVSESVPSTWFLTMALLTWSCRPILAITRKYRLMENIQAMGKLETQILYLATIQQNWGHRRTVHSVFQLRRYNQSTPHALVRRTPNWVLGVPVFTCAAILCYAAADQAKLGWTMTNL